MKLESIQSRRKFVADNLQQCRHKTLDLLAEIDAPTFTQQAHPDFSPIGWHFGHIAYTEAYWILEQLAKQSPVFTQYHRLFAADGLPKAERQNLPSVRSIQNYLTEVRSQVLAYLQTAPIKEQERLWRWLIQHESQHSETIMFVLQLHKYHQNLTHPTLNFSVSKPELNLSQLEQKINFTSSQLNQMVKIEAGKFVMGSDDIDAQDNERPAHKVYLNDYWIDRYPVTCQQYREFITAGGYQTPQYWSEAGWQWLDSNPVAQPLYWCNAPEWDNHPVCGVSYYEAEAYANFVEKRLPTEAEWEKAAILSTEVNQPRRKITPKNFLPSGNYDNLIGHTTPVDAYPESPSVYGCYDMLGNVWEWTASWFAGYQGFASYPYSGYSQVYFDGKHRILRGGSWATRPWTLRTSFRNWYHPGVRQIFAGFRCATD